MVFRLTFIVAMSLSVLGRLALADERRTLPASCGVDFSMIAAPQLRSSVLPHVLNGQFRDGKLTGGLHTFQGLEKFKSQLMRQRGMTRDEVERALRVVVETSPDEPSILHIDARFFPDSKDLQKTLFPRNWNIAKVVDSIRYVAQNPSDTLIKKNGEKILSGVYEGVTVILRVGPDNLIRAAYPEIKPAR